MPHLTEEGADLFGYGAREAVVRAVGGAPADRTPFGAAAPAADLVGAVRSALPHREPATAGAQVVVRPGSPGDVAALRVLAFAHGWADDDAPEPAEVRFFPVSP